MKTKKHELTVGIQKVDSSILLTIKAIGTLTHEDYETITPMIDSALEEIANPKIRAICDCTELDGWELKAAWDDLKIGLKHGNQFEKIAIITGKSWIKIGSKITSWFIQGEVKNFENELEAFEWLNE
ncbi:STAS/SEC14 domain-containing protein [Arcobacter sp. KX21116]|uniref:STAS/SEC14 domain-containing protein n=1 Tax=Arcobacter iocasae TaxID=2906515 RepID=UPI0035D5230F